MIPFRTLALSLAFLVAGCTVGGVPIQEAIDKEAAQIKSGQVALLDANVGSVFDLCIRYVETGDLPPEQSFLDAGFATRHNARTFGFEKRANPERKTKFQNYIPIGFDKKKPICGIGFPGQNSMSTGLEWVSSQMRAAGYQMQPEGNTRRRYFLKGDTSVRAEAYSTAGTTFVRLVRERKN